MCEVAEQLCQLPDICHFHFSMGILPLFQNGLIKPIFKALLHLATMTLLCVAQAKDTLILKQALALIKDAPAMTEVDANKRSSYQKEMQFSVWPALKLEDSSIHGTKAILKYLFTGSKLLPAKALTQVDSLFALADAIFVAACPVIVKRLSVLVADELEKRSSDVLKSLLARAAALATGEQTVGHVYLGATLSVVKSFGVDVAPCTVSEEVASDGFVEEMLQFAHDALGIAERYEMSPAPEKKMYLSTPIYYVNGVPHIGHVFTTTLVDCLARWWKLRGIPCIYSSGTDEHGMKVQTTAAEKGFSPQEWCDKTSSTFFAAFKDFDLHPDVFIRTTEERHKKVATMLWKRLAEKGYIYKGLYEGWYSKREECFVPENQIVEVEVNGEKKHINQEDGAELVWSSETNYMFKLSEMGPRLLEWLDANPTAITPRCYYNQVRGLIVAGLRDLSVSRQNVTWGVPVPDDPGQTMYVWIEALANYLTVAGWTDQDNGIWPADLHTVGKDIVKFHGIYWPAFLLAADIQPYKRLLVHGWWTMNNEKMSKSLGNTLDPVVLKDYWGLEPVKYFLLREATLVTDSDYSVTAMLNRYNNDLADVLGNLVMRVVSPKLNADMVIPQHHEFSEADKELIHDVETLPGTVDHNISFGRTRVALTDIWEVIRHINKYLTDQAPWKLKKEDPRLATVNYVVVESLRIILTCLWPFMPQTSEKIIECLGVPNIHECDKATMFKFGYLKPGTKISQVPALFPKKTE